MGADDITLDAQTLDFTKGVTLPEVNLSLAGTPKIDTSAASKKVLIIGAGVSGLMTAWILLDKGYRVTIISESWTYYKDFDHARLTSQLAGALWEFPPGGCGLTEVAGDTPGFANIKHYREWSLESYELYQAIIKKGRTKEFGVTTVPLTQFFYKKLAGEDLAKLEKIRDASNHDRILHLKEYDKSAFKNLLHEKRIGPEFVKILVEAYTHDAPVINTDKAMIFLMNLVEAKGAKLETRYIKGELKDSAFLLSTWYSFDVIVNATGLGAHNLANDKDVYPVRGGIKRIYNNDTGEFKHLDEAFLVPAQKNHKGFPTEPVFLVPRNDDTLIVGSIIQPHNDIANLDEKSSPEVTQMWARAKKFLPPLADAESFPGYPFAQGLRPFTGKNAKVRAEIMTVSDPEGGTKHTKDVKVVHNYGHGGSGWCLTVGCARTAVYIIDELLAQKEADSINTRLYS